MSEATQRIERDIARTRQDLGDTAQALAAKTDVKARAHDKIADVKASAKSHSQPVGAVFTAAGAGLIAVWAIRSRRRR
jgi:hypothetical protein